MDKWSTRYQKPSIGPHLHDMSRTERMAILVSMVLAVLVIGLAIFGAQGSAFRANTRTMMVAEMQSECDEAVNLVNSLSRTAGADSPAILGKIRAAIHTIDTLNSLDQSLRGGNPAIAQATVTNIYTISDTYANKLSTAMVVTEERTNLGNAIIALQQQVGALK